MNDQATLVSVGASSNGGQSRREFDSVWAQPGVMTPPAPKKPNYKPTPTSRKLWYIGIGLVLILAAASVTIAVLNEGAPFKKGATLNITDTEDSPDSSRAPALSPQNTEQPTFSPTRTLTISPTHAPTVLPSSSPVAHTSSQPTNYPSIIPTTKENTTNAFAETNNTESTIIELLEPYFLNNGTEFDDPDSYQSKALTWLSQFETPTEPQSLAHTYALACIFYATNEVRTTTTDIAFNGEIQPWSDATGWMSDPASICTWFGASCRDNVPISLDLSNNNLTGSFPQEAGLLQSLEVLILNNNHLLNEGDAGLNWLGELTNLRILMIGSNSMVYNGIPPVIGKLTALTELDVSYTVFYGFLDEDMFADLHDLEILSMGGNKYLSDIPASLTRLPNLQYIHAEFSNITGSLYFLREMPQLVEVRMDNNELTGAIPDDIGQLSNLVSLSVANCNLTGTIPQSLNSMTNLESLWLQNNRLTGEIPQMDNLRQMNRLVLHGNDLSGEVSESVCLRANDLHLLSADCNKVSCPCCTCCSNTMQC